MSEYENVDWNSHRLLVMDKLNVLQDDLAASRVEAGLVRRDIALLRADVTGLKVKVAVWSAGIATVGSAIFNAIFEKVLH